MRPATHLAAYRCTAVPVIGRWRVDVLVCDLAAPGDRGVAREARAVVTQAAGRIGRELLAAVSGTVPGLDELHRCRAEVELILRALRREPESGARVATLDDVWAPAGRPSGGSSWRSRSRSWPDP